MGTFAIGELAILQNATYFEEWNGSLGLIVGSLRPRSCIDMQTLGQHHSAAYQVRPLVPESALIVCQPYQLRKIGSRDEPATLKRKRLLGTEA